MANDGEFYLYDLKVETVLDGRTPVCRHIEGEFFTVEGETLVFAQGQKVSMYALAGLLPLLPAKQRVTDAADWMSTDAEIACFAGMVDHMGHGWGAGFNVIADILSELQS